MSGIILPKHLDATGKLTPEQLVEAEKAQEREELNTEIAGRLSPLPPYHAEALVCDSAWWQNVDGIHTKHHGVIQAPVWSHGRCIGIACNRFVATPGICGRRLQDLASAVALGVLTKAEAKAIVKAEALPDPAAEDAPSDADAPEGTDGE